MQTYKTKIKKIEIVNQNVNETHLRSCQYQEECELLAKIAISPTEDVKLNHPSLVSKIKAFKIFF